MKRFWLLAVLMGIFLLVGCSAAPQMETQPTEPEIYTYEEIYLITKDALLAMNKSDLLDTLLDNGLVLPDDYSTHRELSENFVYHYTPMIIDGTLDPNKGKFSYSHSNEMLRNLGSTLEALGFIASSN